MYDRTWLVGRVEKFPRSQKFTLGDRIVNLALDILELLIEATYTRDRLPLLRRANIQLEKLRYLIRLSHDFKLLSTKQYRHISGEINEVGKRIGGWNQESNAEKVKRACSDSGVFQVRSDLKKKPRVST